MASTASTPGDRIPAAEPKPFALQALRSMPGVGVMMLDDQLRVQFVDGQLFQVEPVYKMVGRPVEEALPAGLQDRYLPLYRRALDGELGAIESPDSVYLTEAVPLRDHHGEVTGVLVVSHDLTLQFRAMRAVQASERRRAADRSLADDRFGLAFAHAPNGIAVVQGGTQGHLTMVNHKLCAMLGYTESELLALPLLAIYHPDDAAAALARIDALEHGEKTHWSGDERLVRKDGEVIWANTSVVAVQGMDGAVKHRIIHLQDITEIKLARLRHAESVRRFTAAVSNSPIGIGQIDRSGHWISGNRALCELLGVDEHELSGRSAVAGFTAEDTEALRAARRSILSGESDSCSREATARSARGDLFRLSIVATGITDPESDDGVVGFVAQVQDITDRYLHEQGLKASEQAAAEARDRALEIAEMKSRFVANISHELRTPLSGVLGMLELLEGGEGLSGEQRSLVDDASAAANMLLALINDVLDLSRAEQGGTELASEPVDLDRLLDELRATFVHDCMTKGITLSAERAAGVPNTVIGDPVRLRQILLNLTGNAVKFTHTGGVSVTIEREGAATGLLRFAVTDSGIGIAPEQHAELFEPFHQVDATNTRPYGGTGLGLAITRELVHLMHGEVGVRSVPGEGSTFWFTALLPAPGLSEAAPAATAGDRPDGEPKTVVSGGGRRVLVVEDNAVNMQLALLRLSRHGIQADVAENGRDAVELAAGNDYDLILMDCYMPGVDGFEAAARIRAAEAAGRRTPILALTAGARESDRERCAEVGMDDFLTKPVRQAELDAALARWLPADD